jgi:hypothetical protein
MMIPHPTLTRTETPQLATNGPRSPANRLRAVFDRISPFVSASHVNLCSVLVARNDNEVRIVLSRSVAFVIGDREPQALVLEAADDIRRGVEEVRKALLQVGVARHLVRMAALTFGDDTGAVAALTRAIPGTRG